jgi:hypothetical protein
MTYYLFDFKYLIFEQFNTLSEMFPFMFNRDVILDKKDGTRLCGILISTENDIVTYKTKGGYIERVPIAELKDARLKPERREVHQFMQNQRKIE